MLNKICMVGAGNFGTTMARLISGNIKKLPEFNQVIQMYCFDEIILFEGSQISLVEVINKYHINPKYLPGFQLSENIIAISDVVEAIKDCNFLIFCIPYQFLNSILDKISGHVRPGSTAISLIKGVTVIGEDIYLTTDVITKTLGISTGSLMGANIANDIANCEFCESTIAFENHKIAEEWFTVFDNKNFKITIINDVCLQQICGTFKNIVAMGAGFVIGTGYGESTKAAIIRIGMLETYEFAKWYFPDRNIKIETMFESCGIADFICSCSGARNFRCGIEFAKTGKSIVEIERDLLKGQKLQGNLSAKDIALLLKSKNCLRKFPLLVTCYMIISNQVQAETIIRYNGPHIEKCE